MTRKKMAKYDPNMTLKEILADDEMRVICVKHVPMVESSPGMVKMVEKKTLKQIRGVVPMPEVKAGVDKVIEELTALG
jgi:hypothetical protein